MADSVTVTTTRSWGQRLKSALAGLILGPICIVGSLWGLAYNESYSADVIESVAYGKKIYIESPSTTRTAEHDGKFVHMTGLLKGDVLTDTTFSLTVTWVALSRNVEMYQWKESSTSTTHENMGGSETTTTTYNYKKEWSQKRIDSSNFHEPAWHTNPATWKHAPMTYTAPVVGYGIYTLDPVLVSTLPVTKQVVLGSKDITLSTGELLQWDEIYVGKNPANPEIGDMRIRFTMIPDGASMSALASIRWDMITPPSDKKLQYTTRVTLGEQSAESMFESILTENSWMTWIFRAAGLLVLFIGWNMFFSILPMLGKFIPLLGTIIGFGTGLIAFILTLILGWGTIIIAWFAVRPLYSLIGMAIIGVLIFGAWNIFKKEPETLSTSSTL